MAVGLKPPEKLSAITGIKLGSHAAGLRYQGRPDLVLLALSESTHTAVVFTQNRFAAAPVIVAKRHFEQANPAALLINAGQANAGTGEPGIQAAEQCCRLVAGRLGCAPEAVLPFSTGVIGEAPSVDAISSALPECMAAFKEDGWVEAAHGLMTTDTVAKGATRTVDIADTAVTITGIVKGAGMIRPNMATMLAFIASDVDIDPGLLQQSLEKAVEQSFHRITVDGDTSTNDACVLMATGTAGNKILTKNNSALYLIWFEALCEVMRELAQAIVRDAEGATKFVTIAVEKGARESDCLDVAFTIAHSPLVKTALFASDPTWGRILAAAGRAAIDNLDMDRVSLFINDVCVMTKGNIAPDYSEERGQQAMAPDEITLRIILSTGNAHARIWTSDLSHEYVRINAEYRS